MANSVINVKEENCCGCETCAQICPSHCITMEENERGFMLPKVDETKCISCGVCVSHCPEQKTFHFKEVKSAYAAISKDREKQVKSTSGGVFGVISEFVLQRNGVVVGCAQDNVTEIRHILIHDACDLDRIRQSKYVQSRIGTIYREIKQMLLNNTIVLFSGTACQIAGLYSFLGKEYDSLYTVEVACHGVPSPGLFRAYIAWREEQAGRRMIRFRFRHRELHKTGEHYKPCGEFEDGKKEYWLVEEDPYYGSFIAGKTLRETCYHCHYKNDARIADFTLCDFWGIEKELKFFPAQYGASAVLVNSTKGKILFSEVESKLYAKECTVEAVFRHNQSLTSSAVYDDLHYKEANKEQIAVLITGLLKNTNKIIRVKKIAKRYIPEWMIYYLKRLR